MKKTNDNNFSSFGIASDHAGYLLKSYIMEHIPTFIQKDYGCFSENSVDYPDFISLLCKGILSNEVKAGIAICGTGIGASIVCNRFSNIRAGLCHSSKDAEMTRRHNNANVLVLPGSNLEFNNAKKIIHTFYNTPFDGGRHQRRIQKIETCT